MSAWRNHNVGIGMIKFQHFLTGKFLKILTDGRVSVGEDDGYCLFKVSYHIAAVNFESVQKPGYFLGVDGTTGEIKDASKVKPQTNESGFHPILSVQSQWGVDVPDEGTKAVDGQYIQLKTYLPFDKFVQIACNYPDVVNGSGDKNMPSATWKVHVLPRMGGTFQLQNYLYPDRYLMMDSTGRVRAISEQMVNYTGDHDYITFRFQDYRSSTAIIPRKNGNWKLGVKQNGEMENGKDMDFVPKEYMYNSGLDRIEDHPKFGVVIVDPQNLMKQTVSTGLIPQSNVPNRVATIDNEGFYYLQSCASLKKLRIGSFMHQRGSLDANGGLTPDSVWRIYVKSPSSIMFQNFQYPTEYLQYRLGGRDTVKLSPQTEPFTEFTFQHHGNHVYTFTSKLFPSVSLCADKMGQVSTTNMVSGYDSIPSLAYDTKFLLTKTVPTVDADNDGELGSTNFGHGVLNYRPDNQADRLDNTGCKGQSCELDKVASKGIAVHLQNKLSKGYVKCNSKGLVFASGDIMDDDTIWIVRKSWDGELNLNYVYFENFKYPKKYLTMNGQNPGTGDMHGELDDFIVSKNTNDGTWTLKVKKAPAMKLAFSASGVPKPAKLASSGPMSRYKVTYAT